MDADLSETVVALEPVETADDNTYAAVDLGSNSFHLLVARRSHGELRVLDRIKESVRMAGGLNAEGVLDDDTQRRVLRCLSQFGQRLRGIPENNIRAVATQTFRKLRDANTFLQKVESTLGCPVDIIAGREEARLIYLGVSQGVAGHESRRLVVDIGGGSTEFIIGHGLNTLELESLQVGCVSFTQRYFPKGQINAQNFENARSKALVWLQDIQRRYLDTGWDIAIGSSGTVRAIASICLHRGWIERDISLEALNKLYSELLQHENIADIAFPGMSERRRGVIAGGIAILSAVFEALKLQSMQVSPSALREGVLQDLLGRHENRDPRDKTVAAFQARFGVDLTQAQRVGRVAGFAFGQVKESLGLEHIHHRILTWAADLHETGLDISHQRYQQHSGYLVEQSDMAGFSRQEQQLLSRLVRHHQYSLPLEYADGIPERLRDILEHLLVILRISWIFCRTRDERALPHFRLSHDTEGWKLGLQTDWARSHPLTITNLHKERRRLSQIGVSLEITEEESAS